MTKLSSRKILRSREFGKLKLIGGHKIYHLEGNVYRHSILVWRASKKIFRGDHLMQIVALLHDIGKIETSQRKGKGDWSYPGHSPAGAEILDRFVSKEDPRFEVIKWYVGNHIKPLFWNSKKDAQRMYVPKGCSIQNLAKLALCDLSGSYAIPEVGKQEEKVKLLCEVAGIKEVR